MSTKLSTPVVVDVETTGLGSHDKIVEIAVITLDPTTWETVDEYDTLINPERDVGPTGIHGITASMVEIAPVFEEVIAAVARRLHSAILIAHNLAFDSRMLRSEFERSGVTIDMGKGLCTYRETREKLHIACEERGISLSHHHRALVDARATAELARHLELHRVFPHAEAARVGDVPNKPSPRTLRRGLADAGTSPLYRIVSRAHYPACEEAVSLYLDALNWVLDDGVIDQAERIAIEQLAREWGISEQKRKEAHRAYFDCIVAAAERDGIISEAEREIIKKIAQQLEIVGADIPDATPLPTVDEIRPGSCVCFTGEAVVKGEKWDRDALEAIAKHAGLTPVKNVTKKACDLLVAADVSSTSGKARKARQYNVPILSVSDFLVRFENP